MLCIFFRSILGDINLSFTFKQSNLSSSLIKLKYESDFNLHSLIEKRNSAKRNVSRKYLTTIGVPVNCMHAEFKQFYLKCIRPLDSYSYNRGS